jgi:hypothetical protein
MVKQNFLTFVYNSRRSQYGNNRIDIVESPPLFTVSETDDRQFVQFNTLITCGGRLPERFIGWAQPDLMHICRYRQTHVYIDATFYCVSSGFSQCPISRFFGSWVLVPFQTGDSKKDDQI